MKLCQHCLTSHPQRLNCVCSVCAAIMDPAFIQFMMLDGKSAALCTGCYNRRAPVRTIPEEAWLGPVGLFFSGLLFICFVCAAAALHWARLVWTWLTWKRWCSWGKHRVGGSPFPAWFPFQHRTDTICAACRERDFGQLQFNHGGETGSVSSAASHRRTSFAPQRRHGDSPN
ncbi:MAG: hypothetical protein JWR69_3040 [Pedosphaera sp.]|nr:hypothetical protein [Pedosphaera sp.]